MTFGITRPGTLHQHLPITRLLGDCEQLHLPELRLMSFAKWVLMQAPVEFTTTTDQFNTMLGRQVTTA